MEIQDLGSIGELIAAIATVGTLVYLAVQIRANTVATQTSSRLDVARDYRDVMSLNLNLDNAKALRAGLRNYPTLDYDQRILFSTVVADEALFFQGVFAQHETGQLEDETYQAYLQWFSCLIDTPGGTYWWDETARPVYMNRMVVAVDERIAQGNLPDVLEMAGYKE